MAYNANAGGLAVSHAFAISNPADAQRAVQAAYVEQMRSAFAEGMRAQSYNFLTSRGAFLDRERFAHAERIAFVERLTLHLHQLVARVQAKILRLRSLKPCNRSERRHVKIMLAHHEEGACLCVWASRVGFPCSLANVFATPRSRIFLLGIGLPRS